MTAIRYINHSLTSSWALSPADAPRIVKETGDLILDIHDVVIIESLRAFDLDGDAKFIGFGEFLDESVLERWALGWSFSLHGINPFDALWRLTMAFVRPSIAELEDRSLHHALNDVLDGKRDADTLPTYRLRVDGRLVREFLVDTYDGPFHGDYRAWNAAIQRRTVQPR